MRRQHRLGALKVRVGRHDQVRVLAGQGHQRRLHRADRVEEIVDRVPRPQAEVQGDLVVAAPPRVQLAAHRPDPIDQRLLDDHVDVFQLDGHVESAGLEIGGDSQ